MTPDEYLHDAFFFNVILILFLRFLLKNKVFSLQKVFN